MSLIGYELRRITGRRGTFFGVMAFSLAIALLIVAVVPSEDQTGETWAGAIGGPLVLGATIVAALEGSYDLAQGTMRYLVLTGVPRWKLVAIRVPALLAAFALIALPSMLIGTFMMVTNDESTKEIIRALATGLTFGSAWGLVAMSVGTFLRSNGGGVAVAVVLYFISNGITAFVAAQISKTFAEYLLPNVVGVVALYGKTPDSIGPDGGPVLSYGAALIAFVLWMAFIVGLAIFRVERDEY